MDTKYISLICFGALALTLCFFAAFFTKTEKVKTYIATKGLASFSYIVLALTSANLIYGLPATSLFVTLGLIAFMFSTIIRAIPTRSDMFHAFYSIIESFGFAFLAISVFFMIEMPMIGGIVAGGVFLVLMIIYLIIRKADAKKDKLANLLLILSCSAFFGLAINCVVDLMTIQAFMIAGGGLLLSIYTVLQTFTSFTNKKCSITKNIFAGLGLILLAVSIFFI